MSLAIEKLYKDEREVGKTFKSTKKYYLWEFVLNGKFHKVEMFHSKLSSKKKVCLDAQVLVEDKSYSASFQYSFRIDKNYFNVIQLNMDKFDLRIDNRPFENLMSDERAGRLKPQKKKEPKNTAYTSSSYGNSYSSTDYNKGNKSNIRNKNDDFFIASDDEDAFDFTGGKTNKNYGFVPPQENYGSKKKNTAQDLLNMNDIQQIKEVQQSHMQGQMAQEAFQHNKTIFNNIDNIFEGSQPKQGVIGTSENLLTLDIFGNNSNNNPPSFNQNNNGGFIQDNNFGNMNMNTNINVNNNNNNNFNVNQNQFNNMNTVIQNQNMNMNFGNFSSNNIQMPSPLNQQNINIQTIQQPPMQQASMQQSTMQQPPMQQPPMQNNNNFDNQKFGFEQSNNTLNINQFNSPPQTNNFPSNNSDINFFNNPNPMNQPTMVQEFPNLQKDQQSSQMIMNNNNINPNMNINMNINMNNNPQMNNNSMPNPQFNQIQSNTQNNYQMLNENQPQMNTNEFTNINENLNNNTTQNEFKVRKKYINFLFRIKYYQVD